MYKYLLILLSIISISFSQATIPPPTELANFTTKSFPDDSIHINKTLEANTEYLTYISVTRNIGDFDGDGSEEFYVTWYRRLFSKGTIDSSGLQVNRYNSYLVSGVYSVKKNSYLVKSPFDPPWFAWEGGEYKPWPTSVLTGDFTGDGFIDFVIGDKVYSTSTPIVKKKLP
ncbi:hypothetical protein ACFL5S_01845 [Fibrobacterota bacterium]